MKNTDYHLKYSWIIPLFFLFCIGCKEGKISEENVKITRFERILFGLNPEDPDISTLDPVQVRFLEIYAGGVLGLGYITEPEFPERLSGFIKDPVIRELYDSVQMKYPEMSTQEKELAEAWGWYRYYFPGKDIPSVYTHISGFNQSIIIDSNIVSISLDNYLGEGTGFYRMLAVPIPQYIQRRMTEKNIVRDVIFGWVSSESVFIPEQNDLISGMIYMGKISYLMRKLLPAYEEERIFNFTEEQLKWCKNNEPEIWNFLVQGEYLFSTDQIMIIKYLNEAPYTTGMPMESPGRSVVWTGYRIVERYLKMTGAGLEELWEEQDYHKILRLSKYRP